MRYDKVNERDPNAYRACVDHECQCICHKIVNDFKHFFLPRMSQFLIQQHAAYTLRICAFGKDKREGSTIFATNWDLRQRWHSTRLAHLNDALGTVSLHRQQR